MPPCFLLSRFAMDSADSAVLGRARPRSAPLGPPRPPSVPLGRVRRRSRAERARRDDVNREITICEEADFSRDPRASRPIDIAIPTFNASRQASGASRDTCDSLSLVISRDYREATRWRLHRDALIADCTSRCITKSDWSTLREFTTSLFFDRFRIVAGRAAK